MIYIFVCSIRAFFPKKDVSSVSQQWVSSNLPTVFKFPVRSVIFFLSILKPALSKASAS